MGNLDAEWILNLKSFEVVHGMSRVVMLAPGKHFLEKNLRGFEAWGKPDSAK